MQLLSIVWAAEIPVGPTQVNTTLQQGIQAASNGDVLVIDPGTYNAGTLQWAARTYTLRGLGTVTIVVDESPLFRINNGMLILEDLTIDGAGHQLFDGNNTDLTLQNVQASGGASTGRGGLFDVRNGAVSITDSTLSNGTAAVAGGLLAVDGGSLTISCSSFIGGDSPRGAAIDVDAPTSITDSDFTDQRGANGTIWCRSMAACSILDSRFQGNQVTLGAIAQFSGAGVHRFEGSSACSNAGGALLDHTQGSLTVHRSILFDNTVTTAGLLVAAGATAAITDVHVVRNVASVGAAALQADGTVELRNTLIAYNEGPGAAVTVAGTLDASYNLYFQNDATNSEQALQATELDEDPRLVGTVPGACELAQLIHYTDSPLFDAGDPALLDTDGSRSDIGAYESEDAVPFIDLDGDGFSSAIDCDDGDSLVNPGATELLCSGVDEDCDPLTLDDTDDDADGVSVCSLDCDDADPTRFPGNPEVRCTTLDEDCDPLTLDDEDLDVDGVSFCDDHCDDDDDARTPGAAELLCNGTDDDCDSATVDAPDADQDGIAVCAEDCDDTDPTSFPGAIEVPYDGVDQDCSGADLVDVDEDGIPAPRDCDDLDPSINPEADDIPFDGIDQDCTGADREDSLTGRVGYRCGCVSTQAGDGPTWWLGSLLRRR